MSNRGWLVTITCPYCDAVQQFDDCEFLARNTRLCPTCGGRVLIRGRLAPVIARDRWEIFPLVRTV
jgi:DNA-directed RNA polymerase subunit RPC12/RpoP